MPTVVLLDVSLSMLKTVEENEQQGDASINKRLLAIRGLYSFFDYLSLNCKLEFTALIAFSSLWEIAVRFTRDYDELKEGCMSLGTYDKTFLGNALNGVCSLVIKEWGCSVPVQLVVVTDGNFGGATTVEDVLNNRLGEMADNSCTTPLPFPCIMHLVCMSTFEDSSPATMKLLQDLIELCGHGGGIYLLDSPVGVHSAQEAFKRLAHDHYSPYNGTLSCGHLTSAVTLYPPPKTTPKAYHRTMNTELEQPFPDEIKIVGFLDAIDLGSPPNLTRHLVLPTRSSSHGSQGNSDADGKEPSFCVLLHGSLKVEKMVAFVQLGTNWFGILYSWADSKKKSNLVLSIFCPGLEIPWLGNLKRLVPAAEMEENPYKIEGDTEESPFPVDTTRRRSYHSQASVVWIKSYGLQSDIQKLLRYARKLPDKMNQFYKELNRIRRAALCYSFHELLDGIADMLMRESKSSCSSDVELQLQHAATCLREAGQHDLNKQITAAQT